MNTKAFQKIVLDYYKKHQRDLPWRKTTDPYKILVSEIMLQQTQVDRVIPKYKAFIKRFPSVRSLASATIREVLTYWIGLGYNRRALNLKRTAEIIVNVYKGKVPEDVVLLDELPGIGPYTAGAISTFAFNKPNVFIETNIRTVFIHHFAPKAHQPGADLLITDKQLLKLITKTLPHTNPRQWYAALMDYGSYLKSSTLNPSRRSSTYTKQKAFKGSVRQARGAILRLMHTHDKLTQKAIAGHLPRIESERLREGLEGLLRDSFLTKRGSYFVLK